MNRKNTILLILETLFLVISALTCFQSCGLPYCRNVPFSDEDLMWIPPYNHGDTLLFYCDNKESMDTLVITDVQINDARNRHWYNISDINWMEDDNSYNAIASADFDIKHNGEVFKGAYVLYKSEPNESAEARIHFYGCCVNQRFTLSGKRSLRVNGVDYRNSIIQDSIVEIYIFGEYSGKKIKLKENQRLYINGINEYQDLNALKSTELETITLDLPVTSIVWHQDTGLLQYIVSGNSEYNYIERKVSDCN